MLVLVLETRHIPPEQAYKEVHRAVSKAVAMKIPFIYKKTDSALRGNIGAELAAALEASGKETLSFVPALPGIGRITKNGIHYIDGVPVADSIFGKHSVEPVQVSSVKKLISLQTDCPVWNT